MKKIFLTIALVAGMMVSAQVKIGDQVTILNPNSLLELQSANKGVLFPRVALTGTTDATTVGTQVAGMTVYNTAAISDVTAGMYTSNGTIWVKLGSSSTALNITVPATDNYTVQETDSVIYRALASSATITFPSTLPAGKVFYIANTGSTSNWTFSPVPITTGVSVIEPGFSHMVVTLGGGQIMVVSGY